MNMSIHSVPIHIPQPAPAAPMAKSAAAVAADGAEEIGFSVVGSRSPRRSISRFTPQPRQVKLNKILALLQNGSNFDGRFMRLQRLSKEARSGDEIDGFMRRNNLAGEDAMLVLQQIMNDMGSQGQGESSSDLRSQVMAAQQALDEDMGQIIRARLHAMEIALQSGMNSTQTNAFQDGYLAMIVSNGNCAVVLDELLRRFHQQLRRALLLLIQTIGRELDSQWASCEPNYLQLLRQALCEVGGIANTYDECEELMRRWKDHQALRLDDAVQLTRDLVRLAAEPWVVPSKFSMLSDKYSLSRRRLAFLGRLRALVHSMPYRLFVDDDAQQRVYDAIQQALDEEAQREVL